MKFEACMAPWCDMGDSFEDSCIAKDISAIFFRLRPVLDMSRLLCEQGSKSATKSLGLFVPTLKFLTT